MSFRENSTYANLTTNIAANIITLGLLTAHGPWHDGGKCTQLDVNCGIVRSLVSFARHMTAERLRYVEFTPSAGMQVVDSATSHIAAGTFDVLASTMAAVTEKRWNKQIPFLYPIVEDQERLSIFVRRRRARDETLGNNVVSTELLRKIFIAPLRQPVWYATIATVVALHIVGLITDRLSNASHKRNWASKALVLPLLAANAIAVLYSANLSAQAIESQDREAMPLRDLADLARKINQGKFALVAPTINDYIFEIIESSNEAPFRALREALVRRPPIVLPDMKMLCEALLDENSAKRAVVIAAPVVMQFSCPPHHFAKLVAIPLPVSGDDMLKAFVVTNRRQDLRRRLNHVMLSGMFYTEKKRMSDIICSARRVCSRKDMANAKAIGAQLQASYIRIDSIATALVYYTATSLLLGTASLFVEIWTFKIREKSPFGSLSAPKDT